MATPPATVSTSASSIFLAGTSQSVEVVSNQHSSANATSQTVVAVLSSSQERIAELTQKTPKQLYKLLQKAKKAGNEEKIAEIEAARAIRRSRAEGQQTEHKNSASNTSAATETKEAEVLEATPLQQEKPATLERFRKDFHFAKLVIRLAVAETESAEKMLERMRKSESEADIETARLVDRLKFPFLSEGELTYIELEKKGPNSGIYLGVHPVCSADVFKARIERDVKFGSNFLIGKLNGEKGAINIASELPAYPIACPTAFAACTDLALDKLGVLPSERRKMDSGCPVS